MRAIILLLAMALAGTAIAEIVSGDDALLSIVANRSEKMVRVTEKPQGMKPVVASMCANLAYTSRTEAGVYSKSGKFIPSPHQGKFYHVYVTKQGEAVLEEGKGTYPEGTVVLKEKFSDADGKKTELFTAMVKRAKGFNPEGGDWEYFVISGDAKKITQSGKIQSCIDCHDSYQATDYVTRDYMGADHP